VPKFYSELQEASLEHLSSDPGTSVSGRFYVNTTEARIKTDDGTDKRALLRNDQKAVIGNSGTASENIRLHRGAAGVIQLVTGDDATAEGTLSTNINQLSSRIENYTDAGKPATGNAGRIIYITDLQSFLGDNGSQYVPLGGGGGSGSLQWIEDAQAPLPTTENNSQVYLYENGLTQYLYVDVKVPDSYLSGRQINLKLTYYTPDTSNTVQFKTTSTLIIPGTDAIDSVTNQRLSINSPVSLSGAANLLRVVSLDLTSTTGTINSVAVSPGDLIKVRLTRASDSATSEVRALVSSAEVEFS